MDVATKADEAAHRGQITRRRWQSAGRSTRRHSHGRRSGLGHQRLRTAAEHRDRGAPRIEAARLGLATPELEPTHGVAGGDGTEQVGAVPAPQYMPHIDESSG